MGATFRSENPEPGNSSDTVILGVFLPASGWETGWASGRMRDAGEALLVGIHVQCHRASP